MNTLTSINLFRQAVDSGSKHVMSIEKRLRVRLLSRNSHKLSLSEPGKLYFERCTGITAPKRPAEYAADSQRATGAN